jgi:hypothetical protein
MRAPCQRAEQVSIAVERERRAGVPGTLLDLQTFAPAAIHNAAAV